MEGKQNQDGLWANIEDIRQIKKELEFYLHCLEVDLAQKVHQLWLVNGDRSTKYFYIVVNKKGTKTCIYALKGMNGEWYLIQDELKDLAMNFVINQFT